MDVISIGKPHECHYCNKRFGRKCFLRRHMESLHTGEESQTDVDVDSDSSVDYYKPQLKRSRIDSDDEHSETESTEDEQNESDSDLETDPEEESDEDEVDSTDEDDPSSDLEDNATFRDWLDEAKDTTKKPWRVKYEKYINEGMDADQAKEKAHRKTLWELKRIFFNRYKDFLSSYLYLKDNETHLEVVEELEDKIQKGMDVSKALNRVVPKHRSKFKGLFHSEEDDVK